MRIYVQWTIVLYLLVIWTNGMSDAGCREGYYGQTCEQQCGECLHGSPCNDTTGHCPGGCRRGWMPEDLCNTVNKKCSNGSDCVPCGRCKTEDSCSFSTGFCLDGCAPKWQGIGCKNECTEEDCTNPCNCLWSCECDFQQLTCTADCSLNTDDTDNTTSLDIWVVVICLVVAFFIPGALCLLRCFLLEESCRDNRNACCATCSPCCELSEEEGEERKASWSYRWRWFHKRRRQALRPFNLSTPDASELGSEVPKPSSHKLRTFAVAPVLSGYRWKKKWIMRKQQSRLKRKRQMAIRRATFHIKKEEFKNQGTPSNDESVDGEDQGESTTVSGAEKSAQEEASVASDQVDSIPRKSD